MEQEDILYCQIPEGMEYDGLYKKYLTNNQQQQLEEYVKLKQSGQYSGLKAYYKVLKAIYGTKQGALQWYRIISSYFEELGYSKLLNDQCLYIIRRDNKFVIFALYADDIFGCTNYEPLKQEILEQLNKRFICNDVGNINKCLGCIVERDKETGDIILFNHLYIQDVIKTFIPGEKPSPVNTPMPPGKYLTPEDCPPIQELDLELQSRYRSLIGSLMYAALFWRPDIAQATAHLSRFLHAPGIMHWKYAIHILKYLQGTTHYGLLYKHDPNADP
jgi:hypothetical protein